MSNKRKPVVEGQQVRVKRGDYHGIMFGAVCTVVDPDCWQGDVLVEGPLNAEYTRLHGQDRDTQYIELADILHAPQANRKEAA